MPRLVNPTLSSPQASSSVSKGFIFEFGAVFIRNIYLKRRSSEIVYRNLENQEMNAFRVIINFALKSKKFYLPLIDPLK